MTADTIRG